MIDPKIWESEQVMSLSPELFKIYIYLISQSDDEGRMKISYKLFRVRIFPFKNVKMDQMKKWLIELHRIGLVKIYSDDDSEYIYHPNWHNYQKISHSSQSILPNPKDCTLFPEDSGALSEDSGQFSLVSLVSIDKINKGSSKPTQPADDNLQLFIKTIIDDWNKITGQSRNPDSKDIKRLLKARYNDGYTDIESYKLVHRYIYSTWHGKKWINNSNGKPSDFYIRPKTIYSEGKLNGYGDGFAEYLEQAKGWREQKRKEVIKKRQSAVKKEEYTDPDIAKMKIGEIRDAVNKKELDEVPFTAPG